MRKYINTIAFIAVLFLFSNAAAIDFPKDEYGVEQDYNVYDSPNREDPFYDYDYTEGIQLRADEPGEPGDPGWVPLPGGLVLMIGLAGVYTLRRYRNN